MKNGVLKKFCKFTGKYLSWSLFLIKWQAFWPATSLKRDSNKVFSCEYLEIFKIAYFEVETLENEIYSSFFMSEVIHSLLSKVKHTETLFSKRNVVHRKILI